jgi:regulator of sirC expression with transglutaminase-like and TPR domain
MCDGNCRCTNTLADSLRAEISELENQIHTIVSSFITETGFLVESIELFHSCSRDSAQVKGVRVRIDLMRRGDNE